MRAAGSKGILLLEVLLSVSILAGALILVSVSLSASKRLMMKSREISTGTLLLRQALFEVWAAGESDESQRDIIFSGDNQKWAGRVETKPFDKGILLVHTEVSPPGGRGSGVFADTLVFQKEQRPAENAP